MLVRASVIFLVILSASIIGFGQTSFMSLTPGRSTKAEVEQVLGQPVSEVSGTLSEYKSDKKTEKIYVQYQRDSFVIARIEAIYPNTIDRSTAVRSLNLPARPTASQINMKGKLEEYFAAANVVLTHASGDATSGVTRVGYYCRELFENAIAKVPRGPQTQDRGATADSSGSERGGPPESAPQSFFGLFCRLTLVL